MFVVFVDSQIAVQYLQLELTALNQQAVTLLCMSLYPVPVPAGIGKSGGKESEPTNFPSDSFDFAFIS